MTHEEILTKIQSKAIANGYKGYTMPTAIGYNEQDVAKAALLTKLMQKDFAPIMIFNHDFAKAFWGEERWDGVYMQGLDGEPITPWKYHLQKNGRIRRSYKISRTIHMKILSLFDGISCARVAYQKVFEQYPDEYYASEIDHHAIKIATKNYKNIKHVGGVQTLNKFNFPHLFDGSIDLLIGGSPCQDLSIAKKNRKGLDGERSGLFWEYVRILKEVKPKYFILENVNSMPKEAKELITKTLGVEPIMINASLVSAQHRKRLFWTNIPNVTLPEDKGILLKDIIHETLGQKFDLDKYIIKGNHLNWITDKTRLQKKYTALNGEKSLTMMARQYANWNGQYVSVRVGKIGKGGQGDRIYSVDGKSVALSALGGGRGAKTGLYLIVPEATKIGFAVAVAGDSVDFSFPTSKTRRGRVGKKAKNIMTSSNVGVVGNGYVRKLTPTECGRLQGLPDGYLDGISDSQAYKCAGNAFNVDVIAHILKFIPQCK